MRMIFLGVRNFHFFNPKLLAEFQAIVVASASQVLPKEIEETAQIVRVPEIFNPLSKTHEFALNETVLALKSVLQNHENTRLFCNQEANLLVAEQVRTALGLPSHLDKEMAPFRDKLLMKSLIVQAGLRTPHYLDEDKEVQTLLHEELCALLGHRFIIKPRSSVGSRGIFKVFDSEVYTKFLNETRSDDCEYEAEEFIDGTLYHCDMVIQDEECLFSVVSRYSCPNADLQEGRTLGSIIEPIESPLTQEIADFSLNCLRALGLPNGCFHMEIFYSNQGELVFLEVAARSPGLDIVPRYQAWLGVNFYDMELTIQAGRCAKSFAKNPLNHLAQKGFFAIFPRGQGKITQLNLPQIRSQYHIDWQVNVGQETATTTTNLDFGGKITVTSPDAATAYQDFEYITQRFQPISYEATELQ